MTVIDLEAMHRERTLDELAALVKSDAVDASGLMTHLMRATR